MVYLVRTERSLVTGDPANPVEITREMRAAPIADPATDKARVIIVTIAAAVTGIIDRIA